MGIRQEMPLLARHAGEWKGTYLHVDADATIIDQHRSHLICTFPEDGPHQYFQTNIYEWRDGRREKFDFPAIYRDRRIWWDTERIVGSAWEIDENTIVLTWTRKDLPGASLYEMIQLCPEGHHRARTWHWFKDGELYQRTLIKEERFK
ncbi:MAG: DUF3598 domain-containing protein [Proteobacteria bacterium]|nr:DUF3598 domain-containing protein [Pseudomonadota bacterium]